MLRACQGNAPVIMKEKCVFVQAIKRVYEGVYVLLWIPHFYMISFV